MKDRNAKVILTILVIYLIIMLILFLPNYLRNKHDKLYILSGTFVKIKYENGKWSNITDSNDYKLKEFMVYENNQYKGNYKVLLSNRFYLYDSSGTSIDYEGPLFAYNGTMKMDVVGIETMDEISEADSYIIEQLFSSKGITYNGKFNLFQKTTLDVDNDGQLETIYCINNYYVEDAPDQVVSIIFMNKNGKNIILEEKVISVDKIYEEPSYEIHKILDIKNDKKYELLFTQNYFSEPEKECAILSNLTGKREKINNFCD